MVVLTCDEVELASWPLWWSGRPGLEAVDELARLQVVAARLGCSIRLRGAGVELCDLIDLVGLGDVLLCDNCRTTRPRKEVEGDDETGPSD